MTEICGLQRIEAQRPVLRQHDPVGLRLQRAPGLTLHALRDHARGHSGVHGRLPPLLAGDHRPDADQLPRVVRHRRFVCEKQDVHARDAQQLLADTQMLHAHLAVALPRRHAALFAHQHATGADHLE